MNGDFRFLVLVYLVLVSAFNAHRAEAGVVLQGGGAAFPYPLYAKWFAAFSEIDKGVDFNYQRVGSGEGQRLITNQLIDFGASDAPMSSEALANAPGKILHIPTVGGADVIIFNLHNVKELQLDGPTLAAIYLGKITQWNDPAIAKANPGVTLPATKIQPVVRSDGSGTTFVFTTHLSAISDAWKNGPGAGKSVNFPSAVAGKGNPGVTALIKETPGAIGYVEYGYAVQTKMPMATLQNKSGNYADVTPSLKPHGPSSHNSPQFLREGGDHALSTCLAAASTQERSR